MRMQSERSRAISAAGLMAIVGFLCVNAGRVMGQEPAASPRHVELPASMVVRCKASTALVDLQWMGSGSAACVSADGFFLTNHHVVEGVGLGNSVKVVVHPGQKTERVLLARVVKLDEDHDLALIKVDGPRDLSPIALGTDDGLVETMPLTAFGYPFGRMLSEDDGYPAVSVNTGTVTALRRKNGELASIQLDAAVNPGNSGGPVVDKRGNLIGIVVSGVPGARVNFAIPVSRVRRFLAGPCFCFAIPVSRSWKAASHASFEIDAYAFDRRSLDNLEVELALAESTEVSRTIRASARAINSSRRARLLVRA